jgi:hypothetical protein
MTTFGNIPVRPHLRFIQKHTPQMLLKDEHLGHVSVRIADEKTTRKLAIHRTPSEEIDQSIEFRGNKLSQLQRHNN